MSTIRQLVKNTKGRVYVYLANETIAKQFLDDAEKEGFTFSDGVKPTEREPENIFALNKNMTINYVGTIGHMAYGCADSVGGEKLVRVDYMEIAEKRK